MKTQSKAQAMSLFEKERAEFLANARWVAYTLSKRKGNITIDDVREEIKIPSWVNAKVLGAVFNQRDYNDEPMWNKIGYTTTKVKSSHGRPIAIWRHKDFISYQGSLL